MYPWENLQHCCSNLIFIEYFHFHLLVSFLFTCTYWVRNQCILPSPHSKLHISVNLQTTLFNPVILKSQQCFRYGGHNGWAACKLLLFVLQLFLILWHESVACQWFRFCELPFAVFQTYTTFSQCLLNSSLNPFNICLTISYSFLKNLSRWPTAAGAAQD